VKLALLLYGLGTVSLCGLAAIVAQALPWWAELAAWSVIAVTGLGIALFDRPSMPGANPAYVFITVYLPLGIAVIATVALVITFATRFSTRMNR
jgi:Mn2+/Fe2+ NRAMP family transporter